jgi:hypothetical protein
MFLKIGEQMCRKGMRLAKEGVSNLGPWGNKYLAMGAFCL